MRSHFMTVEDYTECIERTMLTEVKPTQDCDDDEDEDGAATKDEAEAIADGTSKSEMEVRTDLQRLHDGTCNEEEVRMQPKRQKKATTSYYPPTVKKGKATVAQAGSKLSLSKKRQQGSTTDTRAAPPNAMAVELPDSITSHDAGLQTVGYVSPRRAKGELYRHVKEA